jgi:hypothetical protein
VPVYTAEELEFKWGLHKYVHNYNSPAVDLAPKGYSQAKFFLLTVTDET